MKSSLATKKAAKTRQGQRQVFRARGEQLEGTFKSLGEAQNQKVSDRAPLPQRLAH